MSKNQLIPASHCSILASMLALHAKYMLKIFYLYGLISGSMCLVFCWYPKGFINRDSYLDRMLLTRHVFSTCNRFIIELF